MAKTNRVFIGFAIEDKVFRDFLVQQARDERSPFEFVDMSVKEPWDEAWKTKCRIKIKGCDGMIALVSKNTAAATGARWEVACAKSENVPVLAIYTQKDNKPASLPSEFAGVKVVEWTWPNIKAFIDSL